MSNPVPRRNFDTGKRDFFIAIFVAIALFGFILYGFFSLGNSITSNNMTGKIIAKNVEPVKESQITFHQRGMNTREIDGYYHFEVDVKGKVYIVPVEKPVYEANEIGQSFTFPRPPE